MTRLLNRAVAALLAAALVLRPAIEARANCTLDGHTTTQLAASTSPTTTAITTANANDIIVISTAAYKAVAPGPHITSITGGGLTFTNRTPSNGYSSPDLYGAPGTWYGVREVWWALASSTLSSQSFTINFDATVSGQSVALVIGVSGVFNTATPWDANVSLEATTQDLSGSNSTAQVTGVSTTTGQDFLLSYCWNWSAFASCPGADPGGWTKIDSGTTSTVGFNEEYKTVSTPQSSVTIPTQGSSIPDWSGQADALACGPTIAGGMMPHAPW